MSYARKVEQTYQVDVIREFRSLVLIQSVANIGVGALYSDLAALRDDAWLSLRAQLDVELEKESIECVRSDRSTDLNPIVQLDLSACVDTDMLECFSRDIIRLAVGLDRLEDCGLVHASWGIRAE